MPSDYSSERQAGAKAMTRPDYVMKAGDSIAYELILYANTIAEKELGL